MTIRIEYEIYLCGNNCSKDDKIRLLRIESDGWI